MAVSQVRVQLQGVWHTLSYNAATLRWEGQITPSATSFHQPGGYFAAVVEATGSGGSTDTDSGVTKASLRLFVQEKAAPTLTLVSPPAGFLNTDSPQFLFQAVDEPGGSGIDPDSASAQIDGEAVPCSAAAGAAGAYSISVQAQELTDGPHTVRVTAADHDGNAAVLSVKYHVDTVPPVLTVASPPPGYVTTARPAVVLTAEDEAGGSGVDMSTLSIRLDGIEQTEGIDTDGGRVSFTPAAPLADGAHTVTAGIRDRAGNQASIRAGYVVDTVPPALWVDLSDVHVVVDDRAVHIRGETDDVTASPVAVTVGGLPAAVDGHGRFELDFPLEVGENRIQVAAADSAGLVSRAEVYRIRLVTDRTQADVDGLRALLGKPAEEWTETERMEFYRARARGAYNYTDLNRVCLAADWLAGWLTRYGYGVDVSGKRGWTAEDIPTEGQAGRYLDGVKSIQAALPVTARPPERMEKLNRDGANAIELALVQADALRPFLDLSYPVCGEPVCGEF